MTLGEQRLLDHELELHRIRIDQLANRRLDRMVKQFVRRFPTHILKILFGNGTELIVIDERYTLDDINSSAKPWLKHRQPDLLGGSLNHREVPGLGFVLEAIDDVDTITDGYRRGSPDDLTTIPRKRRACTSASPAVAT